MRALIQRVSRAEVRCSSGKTASIGIGYVVLIGVARGDTQDDLEYLSTKIPHLRLFPDNKGVMNLSLLEMLQHTQDESAGILLISQFTLHAETRKGRRPYYGRAADPQEAVPAFDELTRRLSQQGIRVETGVFGDHMDVELVNDGPVTILLDSADR